jgi:Lon-like protease
MSLNRPAPEPSSPGSVQIVMLDNGTVSAPRKPSLVRRVASALPFVGLLIAILALVLANVSTDYVAYAPGEASDLSPRITLSGAKQYKPKGHFLLATVGLTDRLNGLQWIQAKINPDYDLKPYKVVYPGGRETELKQSRVMMDDSKTLATLAALRYLGQDGVGSGVTVKEVFKNLPATGKLLADDVITSVGGNSICVATDLRTGILKQPAGTPVLLTVLRKGKMLDVELVPTTIEGRRVIGVAVETVKCDLPVKVKIDTASIGGPSAGLSMTLAILDLLTPGELTGGTIVAATGTIDADGSVGDVGGVRQKTAGVRSAGAKLFLVPPGEASEARSRAGDLPVVPVTNLEQAIAALRQYGGQSLPSPRATP